MITKPFEIEHLNWEKGQGLIPAIIQDADSLQVLMMGYMNQAALEKSLVTKKVTFYTRTKKRLWTKGETSEHYLIINHILMDCDQDALLVLAKPMGPTCHLNQLSCFKRSPCLEILNELQEIIQARYQHRSDASYLTKLFDAGLSRIAQKVGEEGLEVALASVQGNKNNIKHEVADLVFHILVLLKACDLTWDDIMLELRERRKPT